MTDKTINKTNPVGELLIEKGGDTKIAAALKIGTHVPRDWRRRGSIPIAYWSRLYEIGITESELLTAHNAKAPADLAPGSNSQAAAE